MASTGIKVLNSGPIKLTRAETSGKAMAFVSGGEVRVETAPATGAVRVIGAPGPAGRDGADGAPGPAADTTNLALDGGNF